MAARFWVGGAAAWDGTAGTKWSLTSGGAGGQAVPTSSDDVSLDAASGAVACTVTGSRICKSLTCTGFTGTLAGASTPVLTVSGNVTLAAGMTLTGVDFKVDATCSFTSAGKTVPSLDVRATGATVTLQDALTLSGNLILEKGTLDANNLNVTCFLFSGGDGPGVTAREIKMGSGTWTLTGTGTVWAANDDPATPLTVTYNTSTIKITDASSSSKSFLGESRTYYNLWLTGAGTGAFIIRGSNTFNSFLIDTPPHTVQFEPGVTTVTSFNVSGSTSGLMILQSTTSSPWDIVCAAGCTASYVALYGSHAHGADFTAAHSYDGGNNFNWTFTVTDSEEIYFDLAGQYVGSAVSTIGGMNWLIGESVGIKADGVDVGDATVSAAGNLTLPVGVAAASVWTYGKRYTSYLKTLRAPQTGNQDGSALGRQMAIKTVAPDILNTPYLKVGSLTHLEPFPPLWRKSTDGTSYTGMFKAPISDSHFNEGVVVASTDKGYPCIIRAIQFSIESEP